MPEGHTIFRTAATLRQWLCGREITSARTFGSASAIPVQRLVGETVEQVEARAKHLLIRCTGNVTLHTHMKMTGAWHVYSAGEPWRGRRGQERLVLEAGDRIAVCYSAPIIELIDGRAEDLHPAIRDLGPDILDVPVDLAEVRRRAATIPGRLAIADLLLEQGVVSGIGNIWRCETLFAERVDPATPQGDLPAETLDRLITTASRLMTAAANANGTRPQLRVYRRGGRPCPRCRTAIRATRCANGRMVWWCPRCQVGPSGPLSGKAGVATT